jgi:hypothetical protein
MVATLAPKVAVPLEGPCSGMRAANVYDFIFGCHHTNLSRVFTIGGDTYIVCCICGIKFSYSLDSMSMVS